MCDATIVATGASIARGTRTLACKRCFGTSTALEHSAVTLHGLDLERHVASYVEETIRRGEETGEIRGDFDVALTAQLVSLVMGTLVRSTFKGDRLPRRETEKYLMSFLFDGIKA